MNIISANEIKKHGVSVLEKQLKQGPIHVFKHNNPLFVVISESDYKILIEQKSQPSGLFAMLKKSHTGKRTKKDIDKQLQDERDQWK
ncbi:MAG: hypothetical protein NTU48_09160 [Legionellales bacterium]|nr:hypothetical protein [Legionellales bacterium]